MRNQISVVMLLLAIALAICALVSRRSRKAIRDSVGMLLLSLIMPVAGNFLIVISRAENLATLGGYIYFVGMDIVMFALLRFTLEYCRLSWPSRRLKRLVYVLLWIDALQLMINPMFGQAFDMEMVMVSGAPYYRLIPYAGQNVHRLIDYGIFLAVLVVFFLRMIRTPRVYSERYSVMFFSMVLIGVWETFYIYSRSPVDCSMIGFGAFGLMVFYFALYYRPVKLLDQMLANIASELPQALFFFDNTGRCVWANHPAMALLGLGEDDFDSGADRLRAMFQGIDLESDEWTDQRMLGEGDCQRFYALEKRAVPDARGRMVGAFLSVRDDTEQQLAYQREKYNATHDSLTGLYTRERLYQRIREVISAEPDRVYSICYLDVNDFKMINDIFGSAFGDYTLRCIADALRDYLPRGCLYGRIGGDVFGGLIPDGKLNLDMAEAIISQFSVRHEAILHRLVIHVGVYRVTEPELDVSVMFDRAHMAQETIKDEYMRHIAVYDDAMRERMLREQHITSELSDAIAQGQIRPYLQAIVDGAGEVVGAEALVRWDHPEHGLLSPGAFVPVLEKNGMIADVDLRMWREACRALARWRDAGRDDLFISINVSPKDFYFMDVVSEIKGIVNEYGVEPSRLRLEITETVMMTDNENRIRLLQALREAGFLVEMDDFGSGYSSLNMLKDMPIDLVKIDMVFLNKSDDDDKAHTILRSILSLAGQLGIPSLSEGVETREQYEMLFRMGCKLFQGFFFAKPMPVDEFERAYVLRADEGE